MKWQLFFNRTKCSVFLREKTVFNGRFFNRYFLQWSVYKQENKGSTFDQEKNNVKWMVFFTQRSQTGEPHRADGQHWGGGLCTLGPGPGPPLWTRLPKNGKRNLWGHQLPAHCGSEVNTVCQTAPRQPHRSPRPLPKGELNLTHTACGQQEREMVRPTDALKSQRIPAWLPHPGRPQPRRLQTILASMYDRHCLQPTL